MSNAWSHLAQRLFFVPTFMIAEQRTIVFLLQALSKNLTIFTDQIDFFFPQVLTGFE
jgi:hypothetical protein